MAAKGFPTLHCILCGEDATISLDLNDCCTFNCPECQNCFTADDVREQIGQWQRVLSWIETAPAAE